MKSLRLIATMLNVFNKHKNPRNYFWIFLAEKMIGLLDRGYHFAQHIKSLRDANVTKDYMHIFCKRSLRCKHCELF